MKNNKKAFTLIELMIVMTIMIILTMAMYTPFAHYQTKQKVRNSAKIITQVLNDARSQAIYWALHTNSTLTWNLDIWVLLEKNEEKLKVMWYPFSIWNTFPSDFTNSKYLLEEIRLEPWVEITSSRGLYLYKAITWSWIYKDVDIIWNKSKISVWFKWATTWTMIKNIEYYTRTYISDIK